MVSKECGSECLSVFLITIMVTTSIFQTLGFLTPFWVCGDDYSTINNVKQAKCTSEGLFFTCTDSGGCQPKILNDEIFGLCITCFLVNIITVPPTLYLVYKQIKATGRIDLHFKLRNGLPEECLCVCNENISKRHIFYLFVFGQVLAFIAFITLPNIRNDGGDWSDDWSATMFLYPSVVIGAPAFCLLVIMLFIVCFVVACYIISACASSDD